MPIAEDSEYLPQQGPGRRCDLGCESWPDDMIYQKCPTCGEPTTRYTNLWPVSAEEGRSAIRLAAFERFYEVHCDKRGQSVDGDLTGDPHAEHRREVVERAVKHLDDKETTAERLAREFREEPSSG